MVRKIGITVFAALLLLKTDAQQALSKEGVPGPATHVVIRDERILNDQRVFILVDSFQTDMQSLLLNPANILEINVFKGENAIKLYGEKAAFGAVVIKTKPGTLFYQVDDLLGPSEPSDNVTSTTKVELNGKILKNNNYLLVDKGAYTTITHSTDFTLDEKNCKVHFNNTIHITEKQLPGNR